MGLEATVSSLEDVSEDLKEEYAEGEDGKFHLKILGNYVPKDKVEDVTGLKSALKKERDNASNAAKQLKTLQEKFGGIDIEEYEQLQEAQREAVEHEAEKKGEWAKLKTQMVDQHNVELQKARQETARVKENLERYLIDAQATAAINELNGNVTLLLPHVKAKVKLVEGDNGEFSAQVTDDVGTPRVNGEGNPLAIKDLVGEMRTNDVYAGAFKGTDHSGGGKPPSDDDKGGGGGGGGKPEAKPRSQMTPREKVEYIQAHGNDEFQKLPA